MFKKLKYLSVILLVMVLITGCSNEKPSEASKDVVIYTPADEEMISKIIPAFEEESGIKVQLIAAATGELLTRIKNEANSPIADVMWGGSPSLIFPMSEYFTNHVNIHDPEMPEEYRTINEMLSIFNMTSPVILVNTDLIEKGTIKGYKDLLDPKYKGMIAHGDSASSSSAFNHLENMLFAMNPKDPLSDESWEYVEKFLENLDGKIINSSGAIHKGVAEGEYAIGLAWETPGFEYLKSGAPVEMVYMEEGVIFKTAVSAVLKGAKNEENGKKFIDFLSSEKAQNILGLETSSRPVSPKAKLADYKEDIEKITTLDVDIMWGVDNKDKVVEKYMDMVTNILE